jgi:tRNA-guanine family transglycosylase
LNYSFYEILKKHSPLFIPVITNQHHLDKILLNYLPLISKVALISYPYALELKKQPEIPLLIDSGSFGLIKYGGSFKFHKNFGTCINLKWKNKKLTIKPLELLDFQEKSGIGGFSLDIPVIPGLSPKESLTRFNNSLDNYYLMQENKRKKLFFLYGVVPVFEDLNVVKDGIRDLISSKVDGIALGGLIPRMKNKEFIQKLIEIVKKEVGETPVHMLGIGKYELIKKYFQMGISSIDSSSYIRNALTGKTIISNKIIIKSPSTMESLHLALINLTILTKQQLPLPLGLNILNTSLVDINLI